MASTALRGSRIEGLIVDASDLRIMPDCLGFGRYRLPVIGFPYHSSVFRKQQCAWRVLSFDRQSIAGRGRRTVVRDRCTYQQSAG
jgi:hypothetical protein